MIKMFKILHTMQIYLFTCLSKYEQEVGSDEIEEFDGLDQLSRNVFNVLQDKKWVHNFRCGDIHNRFKMIWGVLMLLFSLAI